MSLVVLYFLHSTSVLSFYIDVVLTLSIAIDHLELASLALQLGALWISRTILDEQMYKIYILMLYHQLARQG